MRQPEGLENQFIWVDGTFVPWEEANIHIINHGLHYGTGVFEGLRSYGGKVFKSGEHFVRLHQSAKTIDINLGFSSEDLSIALEELLKKNNSGDCYIRAIAFKTNESVMKLTANCKTKVAIAAWPFGRYFKNTETKPDLKLRMSEFKKPQGLPYHAKICGLYVLNYLAQIGQGSEFDESIILDWNGFIAECGTSNIFVVRGNEIFTPKLGAILPGITRATIFEIVESMEFNSRFGGIGIQEINIEPRFLNQADEVFITGTAVEIGFVGEIIFDGSWSINFKNRERPISDFIKDAYRKLVNEKSALSSKHSHSLLPSFI